jgi:putative ABC transport system substrate-binding protein
MPRIGVLSFDAAGTRPDPGNSLRLRLRELGYVEGRNVAFEYRYAEGRPDRLAAHAAELVQLKVELIVAAGPAPLFAAGRVTSTIPIVALGGSDPVREGWAASLSRPGGNVTGMTVTFPELSPKQLEILGLAVPGMNRVAVVRAPAELRTSEPLEAGAHALGLQLQFLDVDGPADFEAAFMRAKRGRAQGLYAIATNTIVTHRSALARLAIEYRLPSISEFPLFAEAGFLLSYGAYIDAAGRRAATYVDKILKGDRPGDLPIERPTEFELVINRTTARSLDITLAQPLLLRANRVID